MGRKPKPRLDQNVWKEIGDHRTLEDLSDTELLSVFKKFVRVHKKNPSLCGVRTFKNYIENLILDRMKKTKKKAKKK